MIQGVLCALDGFLVEPFQSKPLPGVVDMLAAIQARGLPIAVATNQAGPLWRETTGHEKYPTVEQVADRLREAAGQLGLEQSPWYISLADRRVLTQLSANELHDVLRWMPERIRAALAGMTVHIGTDPRWRTPEPEMLLATCKDWGITPSEALYGGSLDTDRAAAEAAGMGYAPTFPLLLSLLESRG